MTATDFSISVAMATCNGEAFVQEQIESILRQTRLPNELVISDDCSNDRTIEVIKTATVGCPFPVRILQNSVNVGLNGNFEIAITEAKGDLVIPADQDDYWLPERVSATASVFAEDVILAFCDAELTDSDLRPTGTTLFGCRPRLRGVTETGGAERTLAGAALVQGMTIAFHRDLKRFVLPFSDQCTWDRWLSLIAPAFGKVRAIDRPLVYYRRHGKNLAGPLESEENAKQQWIRAADQEVYAYRASRLEAVHRRLKEIKARELPLPSGNRLEEFLETSWYCLRFARRREKMKRRPRINRLFGALSSLVRGDYHRYADGARSCVLDLAAR
jgi:glycosyltransferase involved in cell wall biosynthesis